MQLRPLNDTSVDAEHGRQRRRAAARSRAGPAADPRSGGVARARRCSAWPRRSSASRSRASPSTRASSPAAARPSPTAQLIGGKLLQRSSRRERRRCSRASRRRSRCRPTRRSSSRTPNPVAADRHPGQGDAARTPTSTTSACPGCCTAASCGRAARAPTPYNSNVPVERRRELDRHIPGAQVVHVEQLPRRRRAEGVRRDPGGGAAEGRLEHEPDPPGHRQPLEALRATSTRPAKPGARSRRNIGNVDAALASAAQTVSADVHATTTTGHMPIGPSCCVADVHADRRDDLGNTQNVYEPRHRPRRTCSRRCRRTRSACSTTRARARSATAASRSTRPRRRRSCRRRVGAPVRLQFMRWDEHGWTHYGPAIMYDMRAGVDASGNIVAYDATGFGQGGTRSTPAASSPARSALRPRRRTRSRPRSRGGGADTENTVAVDEGREHELPADQQADRLDDGHLPQRPAARPGRPADDVRRRADRSTCSRVAANMDSLAFRLQNMQHRRSTSSALGRACSRRLRPRPDWKPRVAGSNLEQTANIVTGRGIANSHHGGAYAAAVADIAGEQEDRQDPRRRTSTRPRTPASR